MKKIRRITAIFIAMLMLAGMTAIQASADGELSMTLSLQIEGVGETLFYDTQVVIAAGSTAEDLMRQISDENEDLGIVFDNYAWGDAYISEIAGLEEYGYGGLSGWLFRVNNIAPTVGMTYVVLEDGDNIVFFYNDAFGEPGMQYPYVDLSRIYSCNVITFFSDDEVYDEDWNVSFETNPVAGATVELGSNVYVTDENGEILLDSIAGIAGVLSVQIERYDEESAIPTVLRFAPDYAIYIPFADTTDGEWYLDAVEYSVRAGYFEGIDSALNLFAPLSITTSAQLVTILGRIAGETFDVSADPWYKESLEWALENGIMDEDEFNAEDAVTRETFIQMFYQTALSIGSLDMTATADISAAVDYDEISEENREAIAWAVAVGLIRGTSEDELTILPDFEINRAQVCQMLLNYYKEGDVSL